MNLGSVVLLIKSRPSLPSGVHRGPMHYLKLREMKLSIENIIKGDVLHLSDTSIDLCRHTRLNKNTYVRRASIVNY